MKTSPHHRRLTAALNSQIRHYERCRQLLPQVDEEVWAVGLELFVDEGALARWLCEPARSLGGQVPLLALRTARGRKLVAGILRGLAHGNIL
jgi:uncharacterized protein (DUF2384 family)